jgi:hypothetical protein
MSGRLGDLDERDRWAESDGVVRTRHETDTAIEALRRCEPESDLARMALDLDEGVGGAEAGAQAAKGTSFVVDIHAAEAGDGGREVGVGGEFPRGETPDQPATS